MKDMNFLQRVPGCAIGKHEVSLEKEELLKCPEGEAGSSPGGIWAEGAVLVYTSFDRSFI